MLLSDLAGLNLSGMDLVVLAACSTAVASQYSAQEASSAIDAMLPGGRRSRGRGHVLAGGPRRNGGRDAGLPRPPQTGYYKDTALACTQRDLLDGRLGEGRWKHPFFWAAPVMSGNVCGWPTLPP